MSDLLPFETPGAVERDLADVISPIEQIIDDARNGRMFVLVDTKIVKTRVIW
jgi:3,4-dihydroxy 2-butanone 4-phosphate synthase/GTP cyclohydrolase II